MTDTSNLTPAECATLLRAFGDHPRFAKESLRIRAKSGAMVPFELHPAQVKLNNAIAKQRRAGVPVRICYLKAGQVMVSSGTAAQNFHFVPFFPGRHCLAVADSAAHAELVFNYYKGFQENYVPFNGGVPGAGIQLPELLNDKSEELKWANDSFIRCATGKNPHVGRSQPWQVVQVSEFGFMENGATFLDGTLPRVPRTPETMVIVESTGFGEGGPFYELCQRTQNPRTAGDWLFLFFAWFEHPEYSMDVSDPAALQRDLSRDEKDLQKKYNLTLRQLAWRRWAIANNCDHKEDVFKQEYPSNPREAFQGSTVTYLDLKSVEYCCQIEEGIRGELEIVQVGNERRVQFQQNEAGQLTIFRRPKRHGRYVIGADSAEGKDPQLKKGGRSDPDYAAADVIDADTGEQVAVWHGRVTEAFFGKVVYALGRFYNWAFVVPETVGAGRAFLQALLNEQYPTDRIYRKQRPAGDQRPVTFNELGFQTDSVNRMPLLSGLNTALIEGSITVHHEQTAQECRTFVRDPEGHVAAKLGSHDDLVLAKALAVLGLKYIPAETKSEEEKRGQWKPTRYGRGDDVDDDD